MNWTREDAREAGRRGGQQKEKNRREAGLSPAEVSQRSQAVQARWAAERGSEEEVIGYFKKVPIEDGLAVLARMRENCKHASLTLNARLTADNNKDRCEFCKGPKKSNRQWALVRPMRDPLTLLVQNHYYCSVECVALSNRRDQGLYGVSDRGMLPEMNPQYHPKETKEESGNGETKKD